MINRLRNFFNKSIQRKLLLVLTIVVTLTMIIFGIYLVNSQNESSRQEIENRAERTSKLLANTMALPMWNIDADSLKAQATAAMEDGEINAIRIYETGKEKPLIEITANKAAIDPIAHRKEISYKRGDETVPLGVVEIIYTQELRYQALMGTRLLILAVIVVLIALLVISVYAAMGRFVIAPLQEITHGTANFARGDYSTTIPVRNMDEVGTLAQSFNQMIEQIKTLIENLEHRVQERTNALETRVKESEMQARAILDADQQIERRIVQMEAVSETARSIAIIHNLQELLPQIAQVISEKFGFYHVGIFLNDKNNEFAIFSASNSEGGQKMLARNHRLKIGAQGIVGYVTHTGKPRIAENTGADEVFFKNPDLPQTRSEMALPLIAGSEIIGALDVQSIEENAFNDQDVQVLSILADQVSIAIQNARLFETTEKSLAEVNAIYRQSLRETWSKTVAEQTIIGYSYSGSQINPLKENLTTTGIKKALENGEINITEDLESPEVAVPIKIRGETIGILNVRAPNGHHWKANQLSLVRAIADRVATSAENARLFEETTNRAEREKTVSDITTKIRTTNNPDEMLAIAIAELKQALKVQEIRIVPAQKTTPEA